MINLFPNLITTNTAMTPIMNENPLHGVEIIGSNDKEYQHSQIAQKKSQMANVINNIIGTFLRFIIYL